MIGGPQCHGEATIDSSLCLWLGGHSAFFTTGWPQCHGEATIDSLLLGGHSAFFIIGGDLGFFIIFMSGGHSAFFIIGEPQWILHYIYEWGATVRSLLFWQQCHGEATMDSLRLGGHSAFFILGGPLYNSSTTTLHVF